MNHPNPAVAARNPQMLEAQARQQWERQQLQELYRLVRQLRAEQGLSALRRILERRLEDQMSTLLRCPQVDLPFVQARAAVYDSLLNDLFRDNALADA